MEAIKLIGLQAHELPRFFGQDEAQGTRQLKRGTASEIYLGMDLGSMSAFIELSKHYV